ncbi:hypothetical protein Tco_0500589 [Tanacetum coccineum]
MVSLRVSKVDRLECAYTVYPILPAILNQSRIIWEVEFFEFEAFCRAFYSAGGMCSGGEGIWGSGDENGVSGDGGGVGMARSLSTSISDKNGIGA